MRKKYLGELEEIVLLTVALLYDQAYGVAINGAIEQQTGRAISISAIHATLHRLQKKDLSSCVWVALQQKEGDEGNGFPRLRLRVVTHCTRLGK